jgi:hypothetical protein
MPVIAHTPHPDPVQGGSITWPKLRPHPPRRPQRQMLAERLELARRIPTGRGRTYIQRLSHIISSTDLRARVQRFYVPRASISPVPLVISD